MLTNRVAATSARIRASWSEGRVGDWAIHPMVRGRSRRCGSEGLASAPPTATPSDRILSGGGHGDGESGVRAPAVPWSDGGRRCAERSDGREWRVVVGAEGAGIGSRGSVDPLWARTTRRSGRNRDLDPDPGPCVPPMRQVSRSPARTSMGRLFSGGASGHAQRGSNAQDGWVAKLKSRISSPVASSVPRSADFAASIR